MSGGRPTKLTDELTKEIVGYIEDGMFIKDACILAGIGRRTYYHWLGIAEAELKRLDENPRARLKKDAEPYVEFLHTVTCARAKAEYEALKQVRNGRFKTYDGGNRDWKAAAWFLEHSFPDKYKQKVGLEHSGEVQSNVQVIISLPDNGRDSGE